MRDEESIFLTEHAGIKEFLLYLTQFFGSIPKHV